MRTEENKQIDDVTYTVRMLDPDTAVDMLVDLFDMIGSSISAIVSAGDDGDEEQAKALSLAIGMLVGKVDKVKIRDMVHKLCKVSDADGKPLGQLYKIHFMGRIGHMAKWLVFALQVQYRDFGDVIGSIPGLQTPLQNQVPEAR